MKKNKKNKEVILDENGNPIDEKKSVNWKEVGKKVGLVLVSAAVGIVVFCAIGVAMVASESGSSNEPFDGDPGTTGDSGESSEDNNSVGTTE